MKTLTSTIRIITLLALSTIAIFCILGETDTLSAFIWSRVIGAMALVAAVWCWSKWHTTDPAIRAYEEYFAKADEAKN